MLHHRFQMSEIGCTEPFRERQSFPHLGTTNNHSIGSYPRAPTQQQCEPGPPMASFPVVAQPLSRSASGETTAVAVYQFMRDRDRSFDPQLPQPHTHRASIDSQHHPSTLQSVEASSLVESPTRASSTPKVVHQPSTLTTPNEPESLVPRKDDDSPDWWDDRSIQSQQETGSLALSCGSTSSQRCNSGFGNEDGTIANRTG
jgi:hypothetical protein